MGVSILPEVQKSDGSYKEHFAAHGGRRTDFVHGGRAGGATSNARMRLLHFENTFGSTHVSEYCLDAMLNLVLIMARNARPNAERLARLTGTASAAYPAGADCPHGVSVSCEEAHVRRAGGRSGCATHL